ncbi:MAG TPA: MurT ligase domain-containing protein [Actinomycetales bacterium]|nr:MurT ligase domain-containing protein [Actinomycetales bacterium]
MMSQYALYLGKAVRSAARLRGGGTALPGLVVEKVDPGFMRRTLGQLPRGVVVISGTNGKTTTTKMVTELLESQGLRVFTNRTGSNFSRGVVAALLGAVDRHGRLPADIAVLELDEAHGTRFVQEVAPRYSLLLNVMRDQLDRFGEIDSTARLLERIACATSDTVVLNREDPRVAGLADRLPPATRVRYFGLSPKMRPTFPSDDDLYGTSPGPAKPDRAADVTLDDVDDVDDAADPAASFSVGGQTYRTRLHVRGMHNFANAAAALELARVIIEDAPAPRLVKALGDVNPAFGRGEQLLVDGRPLELVLVKNPGGFRLSLSSFPAEGHATMIAINDRPADGRDTSWLWDVDFTSLAAQGVEEVSGIRAYDMALRLAYDGVPVGHATSDLAGALERFVRSSGDRPMRVYATYTAMLALRRHLASLTQVEAIS